MPARISVATIDAPEFINVSSINPKIAKCEIKVLYIGGNRNGSFISEEVARQMAETLPGTPIVGHYIESKEDFGDHGEQIIIDDEGIKFNTLTVPYGFVSPTARIWFQEFEETDELGNKAVRKYLMTEGFLWVDQFPECKRCVEDGNWQSMEIDINDGYWSIDNNSGIEFFIINDAIFSKLCILGEDVEPCFEGANITAPNISARFSKDETFNRTLFSMMKELNETLKGELKMENNENIVKEEEVSTNFSENSDNVVKNDINENEENIENTSETVEGSLEAQAEDFTAEQPEAAAPVEQSASEEVPNEFTEENNNEAEVPNEAPVAEEGAEAAAPAMEDFSAESNTTAVEPEAPAAEEDAKFSVLEKEYEELKNQYSELEAKYQELVSFKESVDTDKKNELISSFSMLSDEEKADVVQNIKKYSFEEIESKLSVLFARKQMSAAVVEDNTEGEPAVENVAEQPMVYSATDTLNSVPDWVKAVKETEKNL